MAVPFPLTRFCRGLAGGDELPDIMAGSGYKNATPSRIYILEGRQAKLDAAADIWCVLRDLACGLG